MKALILTADDYGIAPWINEAIRSLLELEMLGRISVMPNMPYWNEGLAELRARSISCSLGLHFCLTSGPSVLAREEIPLLVDDTGNFRHHFAGLLKGLFGLKRKQFIDQIEREYLAQFEKMCQQGFPPQHIDSHQHIHMIPSIFQVVARHARKRAIPLRWSRECFPRPRRTGIRMKHWFPAGSIKYGILFICAALSHIHQFSTGTSFPKPGYFGILDSGKMDRLAWRHLLREFPPFPCEVNVHPGLPPTPDCSSSVSRLACSREDRAFLVSPWRNKEYKALSHPAFRQRLEKYEIEITPGRLHELEDEIKKRQAS